MSIRRSLSKALVLCSALILHPAFAAELAGEKQSLGANVTSAVSALFEMMPWLDSKKSKELQAQDSRLYTINLMGDESFVSQKNALLERTFVEHVLRYYPLPLYERLLSNIYGSGNARLLAHVLTDSGHLSMVVSGLIAIQWLII